MKKCNKILLISIISTLFLSSCGSATNIGSSTSSEIDVSEDSSYISSIIDSTPIEHNDFTFYPDDEGNYYIGKSPSFALTKLEIPLVLRGVQYGYY